MILWGNIDDFDGKVEYHQWLKSTIFQNIDVSLKIQASLTLGSKFRYEHPTEKYMAEGTRMWMWKCKVNEKIVRIKLSELLQKGVLEQLHEIFTFGRAVQKGPKSAIFTYLKCAENRARPKWVPGHPLFFQPEWISTEILKKVLKVQR